MPHQLVQYIAGVKNLQFLMKDDLTYPIHSNQRPIMILLETRMEIFGVKLELRFKIEIEMRLGHWSLVLGLWFWVFGHWSLAIGHWQLVIGNWSLAIGH